MSKLAEGLARAADMLAQSPPRRARKTRSKGFVIIPAAWCVAIDEPTNRDIRGVAWVLLTRAGNSYQGQQLYFTAHDAWRIGIARDARLKALRELEDLGLIELRHTRGAPFGIVLKRLG